jgi:hypothetical protein
MNDIDEVSSQPKNVERASSDEKSSTGRTGMPGLRNSIAIVAPEFKRLKSRNVSGRGGRPARPANWLKSRHFRWFS